MVLLILAALLITIAPVTPPASFAIFLVQPLERFYEVENIPVADLILEDQPILTATNLVYYDWSNHILHLKPDVIYALRNRVKIMDYFVITADGQRCYLGAFSTAISSYLPKCPTAYIDGGLSALHQSVPEDAIQIELPPISCINDPRNDQRIFDSLAKLQKLPFRCDCPRP